MYNMNTNIMFKVKKIHSFEECLKYVHYLGAIKRLGNIPEYQQAICLLCDKLNEAAGNILGWHSETFKPFYARYNRAGRFFIVVKEDHVKMIYCA